MNQDTIKHLSLIILIDVLRIMSNSLRSD